MNNIFKDVFSIVEHISEAKTKDNKSFLEKTVYNDIAMWWFIDIYLFYYVESLIKFKESKNNLEELSKKDVRKFLTKRKRHFVYNNSIINNLYKFSLSLFCEFVAISYTKKNFSRTNNKILITAENIEWRKVKDIFDKSEKKADAFFNSVITELKRKDKKLIITTTYPVGSPFIGVKVLLDKKINQKDIIHKAFNKYWSFEIQKKGKEARKHFIKIWNKLKKDEVFKDSLKYNNIDLFPLVEEELSYYFTTVFGQIVEYIEMAKKMLVIEKPNLIVMEEEYGQFERALIVAGKVKKIPTIAVQHGIINLYHFGYTLFRNNDYKNKNSKFLHCPIPDKTAIYGPRDKYFLMEKSDYSEDSLIITGQPRYDILFHVDQIYSKEKFTKKHDINQNNKIILWATQCHYFSFKENGRNFIAIFEAIQNIKNVTLIIKQHPGEKRMYTKMIKNYLKQYKINSIITSPRSDIYEQLFVSDLMLSGPSTSVLEAVVLNKPIIFLNFTKEPDIVNYVECNIAIGVYEKEYLLPTIKKLLEDDSELVENRQKFIKDYLYKVDGKATERVVDLIYKTIKENK